MRMTNIAKRKLFKQAVDKVDCPTCFGSGFKVVSKVKDGLKVSIPVLCHNCKGKGKVKPVKEKK